MVEPGGETNADGRGQRDHAPVREGEAAIDDVGELHAADLEVGQAVERDDRGGQGDRWIGAVQDGEDRLAAYGSGML